ncbi:MAG TPA: hypothetical protein VJ022_13095 [Anaerolineales bacterium]|nr:hypothetical protein [Anaerolineales bacterium]
MNELSKLSQLIKTRNQTETEITALISRPAQIGHIGEFIASMIFDINLWESASHKGSDGFFVSGNLANKSVNIKWYAKLEGILDINIDSLPDYYLVLAGPPTQEMNSKSKVRPWLINGVYLFESNELVKKLNSRKIKLGVATSVSKEYWMEAEIYPRQTNLRLVLTEEQHNQLSLFR